MNTPRPESNNTPDHLEKLLRGELDPAFVSILEEAVEAREMLGVHTPPSWSDAHEIVSNLNELWDATQWPYTHVYVSGKIRYACTFQADMSEYTDLTSRWQQGTDERGAYFNVTNELMVCHYFDVGHTHGESHMDAEDDSDVSMSQPTGDLRLTFIHPANFDPDEEVDEGEFAISANEIAHIEFTEPSLDATAKDLRHYFPKIYAHIEDCFPATQLSDKAVVAGLKRFAIPTGDHLYHGFNISERIGNFLYRSIEFDDEYYEVVTDGPVYSVDMQQTACESDLTRQPVKYRGTIVGIVMRSDEDTSDPMLRPSIIMAVPQRDRDEGLFALEVPAESLSSMRKLRTLRTGFGKRALYNFETTSQVARFFRSVTHNTTDTHEQDNETALADEDMFSTIVSDMSGEPWPVRYDEQLGCYLIPLADDIKRIVGDFTDHVAAAEALDMDVPLDLHDYEQIGTRLTESLARLDELRLDDLILVEGGAMIIEEVAVDEDGVGNSSVLVLEPEQRLQGKIVNLVINTVPELSFFDEDTQQTPRSTMGVGVILSDCKLIEEGGGLIDAPFGTSPIMVVISPREKGEFFKVDYIESLGLESD